MADTHTETIIEQFTRQAAAFTVLPIHSDAEAMQLCLSLAQLNSNDKVLDVACGSGILACCMARHAGYVDGLDVTPAMLEQAKSMQHHAGLTNLNWHLGDGLHLPFADGSYSLVTSRYAFHHMPEPEAVLAEMRRVCRNDGRIMIIDVTPPAVIQSEYDALERLRDPSHVCAQTEQQLHLLAERQGLVLSAQAHYSLEVGLEQQLAASAITEEAAAEIRHRISIAVAQQAEGHGLFARHVDNRIVLRYPISVLLFA